MDNTQDMLLARRERIERTGDPELEDYVSFLDEQLKAAERRDRAQALLKQNLSQFKEPGVLDTTAGVVVGATKEVSKAVLGGARDAVQNALDLVDEAGTWLNNNIIDLRVVGGEFGKRGTYLGGEEGSAQTGSFVHLPEVSKNESTGGNIVRGLSQFVVPFLGAIKTLNTARLFTQGTAVAKGTQAAVAAAAVNATAFDPTEQRLSNMLLQLYGEDEAFGKELLGFLAADEADTRAEGRMKLVLEGLGVDTAVGLATLAGLKAYRAYFRARGVNPAEALQKAGAEYAAEAEAYNLAKANKDRVALNTVPADKRPLVDQIEEITGVSKKPAVEYTDDLPSAFLDDSEMNAFWARYADDPSILKRIDLLAEEHAAQKAAAKEAPHLEAAQAEVRVRAQAAKEARATEQQVKQRAAVESMLEEMRLIATAPAAKAIDDGLKNPEVGEAILQTPVARTFTPLQLQLVKSGEVTAQEVRELITTGVQEMERRVAAAKAGDPITQPSAIKRGDTVFYDGGSGVVTSVSKKDGTLLIKDDATGKIMKKSPDEVDTEHTVSGLTRQAGFANVAVLSRLASSSLGAIYGYQLGDEDATLADRLFTAGVFAVGAQWAGGKAAALAQRLPSLMKQSAKAAKQPAAKAGTPAAAPAKATAAQPAPTPEQPSGYHPMAQELAKPVNAGISPVKRPVRAPKIPKERAVEFAEAARRGDIQKLAKLMEEDPDFNLAHIDSAEDAKDVINAVSKIIEPEVKQITGGVRSHDQVKLFAEETGAGVETLKQMYKDVQNLDARFFAHRVLLVASANKLTELAKAARAGSDAAVLAARKQAMIHATLQAQMKGAQTEIARALSAMRLRANAGDLVLNEVNDLLEGLGGRTLNREYINKLAMISDQKQLHKITRRSPQKLTQDALQEVFINGILSAPSTLITNIVGGLMHAVMNPTVRLAAAGVGAMRGTPNRIRAGESYHLVLGTAAGFMDALRLTGKGAKAIAEATGKAMRRDYAGARQVLSENEDDIGSAYLALLQERPIQRNPLYSTDENFVARQPATEEAIMRASMWVDEQFGGKLGVQNWMGYVADALGAAVRLPGRGMLTADEILWAMNYRGELHALGYRTGVNAGLEGEALKRHIAEVVNNPSPEIAAMAIDAARYGTFSTKLEGGWASMQRTVNQLPGARFVFPFVRTPISLMKYNFEHTPLLNRAVKQVREDIAEGGIKRDIATARVVVGSAIALGAFYLARQGILIGSYNANPQAEKTAGVQRNSILINGEYYSFRKLDPNVAWFFGLVADMSVAWDQMSDQQRGRMVAALSTAISQNVLSKSYLTGFAQLVDAVQSNPGEAERKWEQYLGQMAFAFVPYSSAQRAARREVDPLMRDTQSIWDEIRNSIPGLSDTLPPVYDVFGEPVKVPDGLGPDWATPISTTKAATDPARQFLLKLDIDLEKPNRSLAGSNGAPSIQLPPKLYARLCELMGTVKINGKTFHDAVTEVAHRYPDATKRDDGYRSMAEMKVRELYASYKQAARAQLLKENKRLREALRINAQNVGSAAKGKPTQAVPTLDELIAEQ